MHSLNKPSTYLLFLGLISLFIFVPIFVDSVFEFKYFQVHPMYWLVIFALTIVLNGTSLVTSFILLLKKSKPQKLYRGVFSMYMAICSYFVITLIGESSLSHSKLSLYLLLSFSLIASILIGFIIFSFNFIKKTLIKQHAN